MIKVDGMEVIVRGKTSKILSNLEMLGMTMRKVDAPKGALLDAFITGLYGDAGDEVDTDRVLSSEVTSVNVGDDKEREDIAKQLKKAIKEAEKIIKNAREED